MSVSSSGYYKGKYRQEHPTMKMISRKSDIDLIKAIHKKHPFHSYRWINAYARNKYGVIWSDNHVHLCCKYENINLKVKNYQCWNYYYLLILKTIFFIKITLKYHKEALQ